MMRTARKRIARLATSATECRSHVGSSTAGTSAFTLLEVLAAVAILGIWFTVLATVAIQGLRAEGQSARLVRASLAADSALVALEAQIEAGEFPMEELEKEQDEFQIRTRAVPLSETGSGDTDEDGDLVTYLSESLGAVNADLYAIEVEVAWIEGVDEQTLVRSTYAWDSTTYLETLAQTQGGADAETDTEDETVEPEP